MPGTVGSYRKGSASVSPSWNTEDGTAQTVVEMYDRLNDASPEVSCSASFNVRASGDEDSRYRMVFRPRPKVGTLAITRTSGSVVLTQVAWGATIGANNYAVDWETGVVEFPSSAAGVAHTATWTGDASVLLAEELHLLQKRLTNLETYLSSPTGAIHVRYLRVVGGVVQGVTDFEGGSTSAYALRLKSSTTGSGDLLFERYQAQYDPEVGGSGTRYLAFTMARPSSGDNTTHTVKWAHASGTPVIGVTGTGYASFSTTTGVITFSAVNLASHVTGTLGTGNGGTGGTAAASAGGVGYGTGSALAYTSAGTAGHVLQSNGSSAPAFVAGVTVVYNQAGIWAAEDDATATLSGNDRLLVNGDQLRVFYIVDTGGSPDEVILALDGQEIVNTIPGGDPVVVDVRICRNGSTTAKAWVVIHQFGGSPTVSVVDLSGLSNLGATSSYNLTLNTSGDDIIRVFTVEKIAAKN